MLDPRLGNMALQGHERNLTWWPCRHSKEGNTLGKNSGRGRIVMSLFPVSCVRTMTAKNHFNEIKEKKKDKKKLLALTITWKQFIRLQSLKKKSVILFESVPLI